MPLAVTKPAHEPWRFAVIRYAEPYGLEEDALAAFDKYIEEDIPEPDAAWYALYDWDLLDYAETEEQINS